LPRPDRGAIVRETGEPAMAMGSFLFSLAAIVALVPSGLAFWRRPATRDWLFWLVLAAAVAGPTALVFARMGEAWRTDLSTTLWVTVAATMAIFAVAALVTDHAWRLTPLIAFYMIVVAILATIWQQAPEKGLVADAASAWLVIHILVSVATYGLVTIAAVAGLAAFLQERAIKAKHPTALTRLLPALADCEGLVVRLLTVGEVILGFGLLTGMAASYQEKGVLLSFDHKTVLTVAAFVVIGGLLIAHFRTGVRGRQAARLLLLAYLLLTLGYPGVKFVTDVILGR
jgi:ABC-type uncharacterized transport system permease subunit